MSVTSYIPDKCRYKNTKLDNAVYLVDKSNFKTIIIDGGEAYITSASSANVMTLEAFNMTLTEEESLDERYSFVHTLQFSIHGYKSKSELYRRYYVIVKDTEGTYWSLNPDFDCKVTYTYTISSNSNKTDFTFSTRSNYPILKVEDFDPYSIQYKWEDVTTDTNYLCDDCDAPSGSTDPIIVQDMPSSVPYRARVCHDYKYCGIQNLWLNNSEYTKITPATVSYTNQGFSQVDFNKDSCTFSETYDGTNVSHQLVFTIDMDAYKSSWHYNLLEFMQNKYAIVIQTSCGMNIACGDGYGLQPSYTIEGSDKETKNTITITLADMHDQGELAVFPSDIDFVYATGTTWQWVEGEYECVSPSQAKHLLRQQCDYYGNPMGLYECLDGYRLDYEYLADKLIGEFEDTPSIYFYSTLCQVTECKMQTTIPLTMQFEESGESRSYSITCDSEWSIDTTTALTVSPSSGEAGEYILTITNNLEPTTAITTTYITLNYCDYFTKTFAVNIVARQTAQCFPQGDTYTISCTPSYMTIPTSCQVVSFTGDKISQQQIQNGYIRFFINPWDCQTTTISVTMGDGSIETLYIVPQT